MFRNATAPLMEVQLAYFDERHVIIDRLPSDQDLREMSATEILTEIAMVTTRRHVLLSGVSLDIPRFLASATTEAVTRLLAATV